MRTRRNIVFLLCLTLILMGPCAVLAHKVNVFAYVEGETVHTESYFPDGRPVVGGTIEVRDRNETILLAGKTDEKGLFSFPLAKKEDLTIVINAGMGHRNSYLLKETEM
jgi:nickel transport protein